MKILVAIPKPPDEHRDTQGRWQSVVSDAKSKVVGNTKIKDIEWIGEGAILVLSENGLPAIGILISAADGATLPYRVLVLHESADWKYEPPTLE